MIVHGKERRFKMTIGASLAISDLCPDGDMNRLGEILSGSYSVIMRNVVKIIVALQRGYEDALAYDDPNYTQDYMTEEEVAALSTPEFKALQQEALAAYVADTTPSVEVEYKKK